MECKKELRKRMDVCCLQEVRWRGQGSRFVGMKDRGYKLWCLGIVMVREVWEFWGRRGCVRRLWNAKEEQQSDDSSDGT